MAKRSRRDRRVAQAAASTGALVKGNYLDGLGRNFVRLPDPNPAGAVVPPARVQRYDGEQEAPVRLSGLQTREDSILNGLIVNGPSGAGGGWNNPITGLGDFNRDKVLQGSFQESNRISDPELSALFNGNDLAQRIVTAKPKEMFRRGWVLSLPGTGPTKDAAKMAAKGGAAKGGQQLQPAAGGQAPGIAKVRTDATKKPLSDVAPDIGEVPDRAGPAQGGDSGAPYNAGGAQTATGRGSESGPPAPGATAVEPGKVTDVPPSKDAGNQGEGADQAKQIERYAAGRQMIPRFQEATIFGRLYGGGVLIIGADDGQLMEMPLDETNIRTIQYMTWIDRRFVVAHTYYEEIGPKYGEVQVYNIINPFGNQKNTYVHESRVLRFDGAPVDLLMRRRLAGWTLSVLQAPYDTMRQFDSSFQSVANLMTDLSQAVMKINGLAQMISNDQKTLQTRMTMVDVSRSTARMLYLDAENEEFERSPTPLTGVADTIEMQMLRMAAAAEMPVAILFGREPSGLNATGDADFRRFYDMIAGDQTQILEPKLLRAYTLICLAKDGPCKGKVPDGGLEFVWHKLYAPSELEQSIIRWNMAQADDKYIANNTLLPEEVAMSRFRSGELHLDTEIQGDLRREKLATAELAPSGAEKAKNDQENAKAELQIKAAGVAAKGAGKPGAKPPPGRKDSEDDGYGVSGVRCDAKAIKKILKDLKDDYSQEALDWVKAARWRGPIKVPMSQIDFRGREKWAATKEGFDSHVDRIKAGKRKPILLIDTPDNPKYECMDGHHRLLAYEELGESAVAYVATVEHHEGPWDTMHQKQHSGPSKDDGGSIPPPPPPGSPPPATMGA